jgi:hypothetical protein
MNVQVRRWPPLLLLILMLGATCLELFDDSKKAHREQPSTTKYEDSAEAAIHSHQPNSGSGGDEKRYWIEQLFEKPTDFLLVLFNFLLALFTWRLYVATRGLFTETQGLRTAADQQALDIKESISVARQSAAAAELSANAAKVTADALLASERSYIIEAIQLENLTNLVSSLTKDIQAEYIQAEYSISFYVKNYGKTPCTIKLIDAGISIGVMPPAITPHSELLLVNRTVAAGEIRPFEIKSQKIYVKNTLRAGLKSALMYTVWFSGELIYDDVFWRERIRKFHWIYDHRMNGLRPHSSEDH